MLKFNKAFNLRTISLTIAVVFLITNTAYGIDLPNKTHLRKPLLFNTSVSDDGIERSEEVKNEVATKISEPIKKEKLLAKLKRKTKLAIAIGLSVVVVGGIAYLYNRTNLSLHDKSKAESSVADSLLSKQYFIEDIDSVVFLDRVLFDALEGLGYDVARDFSAFQDLLVQDGVGSALIDPSFPSFLKSVMGGVYRQKHWNDVAEVAKIWHFFKNIRNDKTYSEIYKKLDFANVDLVQTDQFQDAARFLSTNTDSYDWGTLPYIFWATLEISKDFESKKEEWKEIVNFLKAEGNSILINDYYFLNMVVKSPEMMTKLKDRKGLEDRISEIYADNPPVRRGNMNLLKYDERQDPSTLSSIALLYAIALYDSFNSEEFRRNISEVFKKDLDPDDGAQEHGGFFKFDVKGEILLPIEIERLKSLPRDQSSWEIDEILFPDHYLRPSFHLHATSSDDREYAGPSLSDMGMVSISGYHRKSYFNAVFTSVGLENSGHLLVNLDAYGLTNSQYFVIDVGSRVIDISDAYSIYEKVKTAPDYMEKISLSEDIIEKYPDSDIYLETLMNLQRLQYNVNPKRSLEIYFNIMKLKGLEKETYGLTQIEKVADLYKLSGEIAKAEDFCKWHLENNNSLDTNARDRVKDILVDIYYMKGEYDKALELKDDRYIKVTREALNIRGESYIPIKGHIGDMVEFRDNPKTPLHIFISPEILANVDAAFTERLANSEFYNAIIGKNAGFVRDFIDDINAAFSYLSGDKFGLELKTISFDKVEPLVASSEKRYKETELVTSPDVATHLGTGFTIVIGYPVSGNTYYAGNGVIFKDYSGEELKRFSAGCVHEILHGLGMVHPPFEMTIADGYVFSEEDIKSIDNPSNGDKDVSGWLLNTSAATREKLGWPSVETIRLSPSGTLRDDIKQPVQNSFLLKSIKEKRQTQDLLSKTI